MLDESNSMIAILEHVYQREMLIFMYPDMAASRAERQLVKTQKRLTRAFDANEFYEAEQLTLSLHTRLKSLERTDEAQALLRSSADKLLDNGRGSAAVELLRLWFKDASSIDDICVDELISLTSRFTEVKTIQTFMSAAMDWYRERTDGVHADPNLHLALATQLAKHGAELTEDDIAVVKSSLINSSSNHMHTPEWRQCAIAITESLDTQVQKDTFIAGLVLRYPCNRLRLPGILHVLLWWKEVIPSLRITHCTWPRRLL
eukprot:TRINITY_DN11914_c0_g1_i2.p2 TRINITY_DN11914_c0_g1~~TRINITY_DN11914_c0_g1_i2.p2  ORF type:complete len:260 (+),score=32.72 TRINITY_DN11914_c0_g1_i2:2330-3109(+)